MNSMLKPPAPNAPNPCDEDDPLNLSQYDSGGMENAVFEEERRKEGEWKP